MRKTNIFVLLITIVPWISVLFIDRKTLKRFLPGAIFMAAYVTAEGYLAEKRKWWWFPFRVKPNVLGEIPLILGPFFVGSLWILKYTFGKFNLYLLINIIIDSLFTYLGLNFLKKVGYVSLVRINKFQLSLIFLIKTILMYGFQVVYEKFFHEYEHKRDL
jgi:hypothetical protein